MSLPPDSMGLFEVDSAVLDAIHVKDIPTETLLDLKDDSAPLLDTTHGALLEQNDDNGVSIPEMDTQASHLVLLGKEDEGVLSTVSFSFAAAPAAVAAAAAASSAPAAASAAAAFPLPALPSPCQADAFASNEERESLHLLL